MVKKSHVAEQLADKLGIQVFSSGWVVRYITKLYLEYQRSGYNSDTAVAKALAVVNTVDINTIYSEELKTLEIERTMKKVVSYADVLPESRYIMQKYAFNRNMVIDGRKSFELFPEAVYKFYFEASKEERASLYAKVMGVSFLDALSYIRYRDSYEINVDIQEDLIILNPFQYDEQELLDFMLERSGHL